MKNCIVLVLFFIDTNYSQTQIGPDPWHVSDTNINREYLDKAVVCPKCNDEIFEKKDTSTDYFFKRLLAILLKSGQVTANEDGSRNIHLHLHVSEEHWLQLDAYSTQNTFCDKTFRNVIGFITESVYKPSFKEKLSLAWAEYIKFYFTLYQVEILWCAVGVLLIFLSKNLARHATKRAMLITLLLNLYLYEAFIAFKEVEEKERQKLMNAIEYCKWMFWSSSCEWPLPDPLLMLKHMHPGKIFLRLVTLLVTEPLTLVSSTVNEVCDTIGESISIPIIGSFVIGPLLKILFNVILLVLIIKVIFAALLNAPMNIRFLGGLISFGTRSRDRNITNSNSNDNQDRITGPNLERLLEIMAGNQGSRNAGVRPIRRSLSAGRLQDVVDGPTPRLTASGKESVKSKKLPLFRIGGGDGWSLK